jgi:uroporphyrinogen-III synthase
VVTRPAGQAAHFATALSGQGAIPVLYPVLEIRDLEDVTPVLDAAIRLDSFDLAVFVSPNAIEKALALILARRHLARRRCGWPPWARAANGNWRATGSRDVLSPPLRFDSEALLELPELTEVAGQARDHFSRRRRARSAGRNPQGNAAPRSNT